LEELLQRKTEVSYSFESEEEKQNRKGRNHLKIRQKESKLEAEVSEIKQRISSNIYSQGIEKRKVKKTKSQQREEGKNKGRKVTHACSY